MVEPAIEDGAVRLLIAPRLPLFAKFLHLTVDHVSKLERGTTPAELAKYATEIGVWEKVVQPRLETLTVNS